MKTIIKKTITLLTIFSLLGAIILATSNSVVAADTTYQTKITKGTDTYEVTQYKEDLWKRTIESNATPDTWFGGKADKVGAESKVTLKRWFNSLYTTYDVFNNIFLPPELLAVLLLNKTFFDYTEKQIDKQYPNEYKLWHGFYGKWDFTTDDFKIDANSDNNGLFISKNPKDFTEILNNYNDWASNINITLQMLGLPPLTSLDGDTFLWNYAISGKLGIATPFEKYLTELVDALDCKNVKVDGNTLIFDRQGRSDYSAEIAYNERGMMSSIVVKNSDDELVYEFTSSNSTTGPIVIIFITLACFLVGLVLFSIYRKRHLNKIRNVKKAPIKTG